jgi:hypothetical protein
MNVFLRFSVHTKVNNYGTLKFNDSLWKVWDFSSTLKYENC